MEQWRRRYMRNKVSSKSASAFMSTHVIKCGCLVAWLWIKQSVNIQVMAKGIAFCLFPSPPSHLPFPLSISCLLPQPIFPCPNPPQVANLGWWPNMKMCTHRAKINTLHCQPRKLLAGTVWNGNWLDMYDNYSLWHIPCYSVVTCSSVLKNTILVILLVQCT